MTKPNHEIRAEALESLLIEKNILTPEAVDGVLQAFNERIGPMRGASLVARAWRNPEFKSRLLADASSIVAELEFDGGQVDKLVIVENTPATHNIVVCTLCSCYPWAVLGLPPTWYKDPAYRSRVVREPRAVLKEFGVVLSPEKEIKVWDSSAEIRYMVLPEMPFHWRGVTEEELQNRVTRDSMIGVEVLS